MKVSMTEEATTRRTRFDCGLEIVSLDAIIVSAICPYIPEAVPARGVLRQQDSGLKIRDRSSCIGICSIRPQPSTNHLRVVPQQLLQVTDKADRNHDCRA